MAFQGDSIFWVEVEKIVPNPYQPRREFDEGKLKELSESVRMYGILQPLTVTRKEIQRDDGAFFTEYELIAGERRLRASKLAGLSQVPVIIRDSDDTEQEKLELAIIENLQREDLNAVDRALAFQQLANAFNLTHDEVAKKVGRSRMYVSNTIRLLGLPDYMLESLKVGDISEGHARTLLMLKDRPEEQDVVFREILLKKLSVREVERIVRKIATDKVRKKTWKGTDPKLIEIEKQFTDALGTRVQIAKTDYGGKVTIDYFSEEDLDKLLSIMNKKDSVQSDSQSEESSTIVQTMAAVTAATPLVSDESEDDNSIDDINQINDQAENVANEEQEQTVSEEIAEPYSNEETVEEIEATPVNPFVAAMEEASDESEDFEQSIIDAANQAGNSAGRPTVDQMVEASSALHEEVKNKIAELSAYEENYSPGVSSEVEVQTDKKDDDSDLYSMKSFSI